MLKIYTLAKIYTFESNFDYLCLYYLTEVYRFVRGTKNTKSEKRITKSKKKKKEYIVFTQIIRWHRGTCCYIWARIWREQLSLLVHITSFLVAVFFLAIENE